MSQRSIIESNWSRNCQRFESLWFPHCAIWTLPSRRGFFSKIFNYNYNLGAFLTSTTVLEDGKLLPQWVFEESFVDSNHVGAVCREVTLFSKFVCGVKSNVLLFRSGCLAIVTIPKIPITKFSFRKSTLIIC